MTAATIDPGRDSKYCGANKRQGEGTCARPAGWGTDHPGIGKCKLHGGGTQSHKAAAKTEMARQAVVTYGLPRKISPDAALLEEVWRTAGHVQWLSELVQLADPGSLTQRGEQGVVTESVWVKLYRDERAHLVAVSKAAIAAGIAERQVRVAEQQGALLAGAVNRILDGLNLTKQQRALVPQVVPAALREITGGGQ
jgi:hypothetical protein